MTETQKPLEILVVEDKEENLEVAKKTFNELEQGKLRFQYANDYRSASENLSTNRYDGIITDLYFPQEIGTSKKDRGKDVWQLLVKNEPLLQIPKIEYMLSQLNIDLSMRMPSSIKSKDSLREAFLESIKILGEKYSKEAAEKVQSSRISHYANYLDKESFLIFDDVERTFGSFYEIVDALRSRAGKERLYHKEGYGGYRFHPATMPSYAAIYQALCSSDERQQPLGILIAEEASSKAIPFIIATDVVHHGPLVEGAIRYTQTKGWGDESMIEGGKYNEPYVKIKSDFWLDTYKRLNKKIGKRK